MRADRGTTQRETVEHQNHQNGDAVGEDTPPRRRRAARWGRIATGPRPGWRGASILLALTTAALVAWNTADQLVPGVGGTLAGQVALNVALALGVACLLTGLLFVTVGRLLALPWTYVATLLASLVLLLTLGAGASPLGWYAAVAVTVTGASLLGAAAGGLLPHRGRPPLHRRDTRLGVLLLAVVLTGGPGLWLATAGQTPAAPADDGAAARTLPTDPAAPGPYDITELTYGSGTGQRPEYGDNATLTTDPADASGLISGWNADRRALWGFGVDALPLNARVWHPQGEGPFPLVLLLHGNKSNATHSEDGFRYLGEQLASHGIIAASVDQNYLNTGVLDRSGGLRGVDAARGSLLLDHLRAWRTWNNQEGNPFTGKVDLGAVGLLGHSRGGEAIATATHQHAADPLDGITIRSLLALAPSDGQHRPGGEPITLRDVNYLVLQGSHDADVAGFAGLNQYERLEYSGEADHIAAAVHIGRANHGQFNSRWGRHDVGYGLPAAFLDDGVLLTPEQQRRIASAYATTYFTGTLADQPGEFALLRDHRAGAPWLPDTGYVSRYTDSTTTVTNTADTLRTDGADSTTIPLPLRTGPGEETVLRLEWDQGQQPVLTADLPANPDADSIVFDAAATTGTTGAVTVRATDGDGTTVSLPATEVRPLRTPLPGQYLVASWMHPGPLTEPVPQTFRIPLDDLARTDPAFDPRDLTTVSLAFDGTTGGSALVTDIGVSGGRP
ncbi:alpha/beta hydrolase [Saccharomonospora piscinae]|uniref:alpha/beta hydrolase n=1 Tax=Saccharomonospora piscinae TaxID=687388 RepID=UPI00159401E2|nr:alpha/beta hydrolase [Saccharomonospora piscinae]